MDQVRSLAASDFHRKQIRLLVVRELSERRADLSSYVLADDISMLREEQDKIAQEFILRCNALLQKERLGELINVLRVDDTLLKDVFEETLRLFEIKQMMHSTEDETVVDVDPELAGLIDILPEKSTSIQASGSSKRFASLFVKALFSAWAQDVTAKLSEGSLARYLMSDREFTVRLVSELETHAYISGFTKILEEKIDQLMQINADNQKIKSWMLSAIAASDFNNFIERGGLFGKGAIEIRLKNGSEKRVFDKVTWQLGEPIVELVERDFSRRLLLDWVFAAQHAIRENANPGRFSSEQLEQNAALVKIVRALEIDLKKLESDQ
jgi:hypothetical protein